MQRAVRTMNLGHGVTAEVVRVDGVVDCVRYTHDCPKGNTEDHVTVKPSWFNGWDLVSEEPLTLSPSLLCLACGHHGFIRDGKWVPA